MGALDFLLNRDEEDKQVVEAPAFSLTKVLGTGAVIVAPIATFIVEQLESIDLNAQHYVALAIGLLGFLAVAAAADVIARSVATAAEAAHNTSGRVHFIRFEDPLAAHMADDRSDVQVLALAGANRPYYLVKNGNEIVWKPKSEITIP